MYYVTHRSDQMQKHKFNVICPDVLFMETAPHPPEHETWWVSILCPGWTGMHYVTAYPTKCKNTSLT
jgi:hypothetical protein